jgi:hypothetical protein
MIAGSEKPPVREAFFIQKIFGSVKAESYLCPPKNEPRSSKG